MTTYRVMQRMTEDRVYLPGETVVDPDFNAEILMARGYLVIVPDDYSASSTGKKSDELRRPTVEEGLAAGYSQEAAEALANGTYGDDPEVTKMVDDETDAIDAASSTNEDGSPNEAQLKVIAAGMAEDDLRAAIETYEIELPEKDDVTREDREAALVVYLLSHPELTRDDDETTIVPSDAERQGVDTDAGSVGVAPEPDK